MCYDSRRRRSNSAWRTGDAIRCPNEEASPTAMMISMMARKERKMDKTQCSTFYSHPSISRFQAQRSCQRHVVSPSPPRSTPLSPVSSKYKPLDRQTEESLTEIKRKAKTKKIKYTRQMAYLVYKHKTKGVQCETIE